VLSPGRHGLNPRRNWPASLRLRKAWRDLREAGWLMLKNAHYPDFIGLFFTSPDYVRAA
jgi:hypothetical protein